MLSRARCLLSTIHLKVAFVFAFSACAAAAHAQAADPPGRVARLNLTQGAVVFAPAGDIEWVDAQPNRPITRGDRLWSDRGARAEMQVGSSALRMDGQTRMEVVALDDHTAQINLLQGSVYLRVRSLPEGDSFEIDTPNVAWRVAYPGDFRIDVDPNSATTRVTVHVGTGAAFGEGDQTLALGGGQQVTFRGRTLAQVAQQESPPQDNFDRWASERNRREDQSPTARHVPREVVGYIELDSHGQWQKDANYGDVWIPQSMPAGWAPYRNGRWEWIAPWGWTWIDDAPWGFAPFHYGRWAQLDGKWAWVPGRLSLKPVYAPALVAFVGNDAATTRVSLSSLLLGNKPGIAWFPLAPGEAWQPGFKASAEYLANVNRGSEVQAVYAYQKKPDALTAIPESDFQRGRPAKAGWLRVAANMIGDPQIVPPPPKPEAHTVVTARASKLKVPAPASAQPPVAAKEQAEPPRAHPSLAAASTLAVTTAPAAAPPASARTTAAAAAAPPAAPMGSVARAASAAPPPVLARHAQPPRDLQAKKEQARRETIEQAREQARDQAREQARREQVARREESRKQQVAKKTQARREASAKREDTRKQQVARKEQAHRELLARQKAEQVAKEARRAEQQRKEVVARREELQRQQQHAQQVEQARKSAERDAEQLREQRERAQREEEQRVLAAREQAQREAAMRQQQAIAEQQRRERAERQRARPDLRQYSPQSRAQPSAPVSAG